MARIEEGYREKLRTLLALRGRPDPDASAGRFLRRARRRAAREGLPLSRALGETWAKARACAGPDPAGPTPRLLCDASLGGLARWLRAAGHDAAWARDRPVDGLVAEAQAAGQVLVTTEAEVMTRNLIRRRQLRAVWVPCDLEPPEQLAVLAADLGLGRREPRCMACGGELREVPKAEVLPRIPPRTARWKDEYFVCSRCDRLFWRGTHWDRIARRLAAALR